ncbi:MAG TPA: hypothetical protein VEA37_08555 [Flavobacterium sp.]|nr:hypothetical protein [Flavobacterium sp.]
MKKVKEKKQVTVMCPDIETPKIKRLLKFNRKIYINSVKINGKNLRILTEEICCLKTLKTAK